MELCVTGATEMAVDPAVAWVAGAAGVAVGA